MEYYGEIEGAFSGNPAAFCDDCLCEIYGGDEVYVIDGFVICTDCFGSYMKERYAGCKTRGENLNRRKRSYDA